jgi:hypothetical protein
MRGGAGLERGDSGRQPAGNAADARDHRDFEGIMIILAPHPFTFPSYSLRINKIENKGINFEKYPF